MKENPHHLERAITSRGKKKKIAYRALYDRQFARNPLRNNGRGLIAIREEDIDCSDIPELGEEFWKNARLMPPLIPKKAVSIRIDPDVLGWFKKKGPRYQTRINAVLRAYVDSGRSRD